MWSVWFQQFSRIASQFPVDFHEVPRGGTAVCKVIYDLIGAAAQSKLPSMMGIGLLRISCLASGALSSSYSDTESVTALEIEIAELATVLEKSIRFFFFCKGGGRPLEGSSS